MQIAAYQRRISGPLLDRIDMRVSVSKISSEHFFDTKTLQSNQQSEVLKLVLTARSRQKKRFNRSSIYNAYASFDEANRLFKITASAKTMLKHAAEKLQLTSRGTLRTLRVARTIADLEGSSELTDAHVAEALQFRS